MKRNFPFPRVLIGPDFRVLIDFIQATGPDSSLAHKAFDFFTKSTSEEAQYRRNSDANIRNKILVERNKANLYRFISYVMACAVLSFGVVAIVYMAVSNVGNWAAYTSVAVIITGSSAFTMWKLFQKNTNDD